MRSLFAAVIPFGALLAQTPAVTLDHEPKHHVVLTNDWVRVLDVVVPAGDSTLYHVHANDYVFITFGPVKLKAQVLGGAPTDLDLADGEVRFTKGPITHRVVNPSAVPFHNLTIEILKAPGTGVAPADGQTVVLDNDRVRAERVVLEPGASTARHEHKGPGLVVAVTPGTASVADARLHGLSRTVTYKAGDYRWNDAPRTHTIKNVGRARLELIEIDWK